MAGSTFHTHALAAVLWHEMAHADGADEREARKREQALWTTFIRDQRVDQVAALRNLSVLTTRPEGELMALRWAACARSWDARFPQANTPAGRSLRPRAAAPQ